MKFCLLLFIFILFVVVCDNFVSLKVGLGFVFCFFYKFFLILLRYIELNFWIL